MLTLGTIETKGRDRMSGQEEAQAWVEELEKRLASLDRERAHVAAQLDEARKAASALATEAESKAASPQDAPVTMASPTVDKVALFRCLFRGREDVFPRRWDNPRSGKSGYSPVCHNEWLRGVCGKPKVKCGECPNQAFTAVTDEVVRNHLQGRDPAASGRGAGFIAGVYPLLPDETCWFLAADFDKKEWRRDVSAFLATCREKAVPAALERSRSGNGGHVWIFFSEPVPAAEARRLGAWLITETMERCPDIGFDSYDRFFPSQDTMPAGGFGNLIALPLQRVPRGSDNSVFLDDAFRLYADQWAVLSTLRRMSRSEVAALVGEAAAAGRVLGVRLPVADEDEEPWAAPPSRRRKEEPIRDLPERVEVVVGN